jgi:hypothetical protein
LNGENMFSGMVETSGKNQVHSMHKSKNNTT